MGKRLLQDVVSKDRAVVPAKRDRIYEPALTTDDVRGGSMRIPPRRRPEQTDQPTVERPSATHFPERSERPMRPERPRRPSGPVDRGRHGSRLFTYLVGGILGIVLLIVAFSYAFAGASVTVFQKYSDEVLIDGEYVARSDPSGHELGYTTISFTSELSDTVKATREEHVEEFASGRIVISNEFDENVQRLIRNTRFQAVDKTDENGEPLIYRVRDSVDVPGMSVNAQGQSVPGTIEVDVYADAPGAQYDLADATFTIPGFEGTSRHSAFSARIVTPIKGGFSGTRLTVEESQEESVRQQLRERLAIELKEEALRDTQAPDDTHLFESGLFVTYESLPNQQANDTDLVISERAHLTGVLFDRDRFASQLVAGAIADYDGNPVQLSDVEALEVGVDRLVDAEGEWDNDTYTVRVRGRTTVLWLFDEEQLRTDLAGLQNDPEQITSVLYSDHPGVNRAEIKVRPFWKRTLPEDPSDISITTVLD